MVGDLGAGQMAQQQRDAVIFGLRARRQRGGFFRRNAEPVHAGVHLQRGAALPVMGGDEGVPLGKLGHAVDDRPRIELDEGRRSFRRAAVEHVDRGVARAGPHAPRLRKIGDEERLAAGLGECGRDRLQA